MLSKRFLVIILGLAIIYMIGMLLILASILDTGICNECRNPSLVKEVEATNQFVDTAIAETIAAKTQSATPR